MNRIRHTAWEPGAKLLPGAMSNPVRLMAHPAYADAKAGDPAAARALVRALVRQELLNAVGILAAGKGPLFLVPVQAVESTGRNKLPLALAEHIVASLWWPYEGKVLYHAEVIQANIVGHTGSSAMSRMLAQPVFDGPVTAGARHVVVDDHVPLGGSLSALADHIRRNGGRVVAAIALSHSGRGSHRLAPEPETIAKLEAIHGQGITESLGIPAPALSWAESRYLATFKDAHSLRDRIAEEGVAGLLPPAIPLPRLEGRQAGAEEGGEESGGMTPRG